ncbi:very short patch repair endonuclease [Simplicispira lacusdiani]|uniref:very short patch repair endonuclease n=1 Tax=Simplicispira lacusdiani TaxID=2213010 RepID=UPI000E723CAD|nr:very short patch repair endonuclease [Simplicispira lacusdiani]
MLTNMDKLSKEDRHQLMSRIRSVDTAPEMAVRRLLHRLGYRYVLHDKRLPGTPDLVFPSRRKVIFVHGCFWHGHSCGRGFKPKTNADFWASKIFDNRKRDAKNLRELRRLGWSVLNIWECATVPGRSVILEARLVRFLES